MAFDFDSVKRYNLKKTNRQTVKVYNRASERGVFVDAVFRRPIRHQGFVGCPVVSSVRKTRRNVVFSPLAGFLKHKFSAMAVLASLAIAFTAGGWLVWQTSQTEAEAQSQSAADFYEPVPLVAGAVTLGPVQNVPNEVLFNLTIDQLETYLSEVLKTDQVREAERLAARKEKLRAYLEEKHSPFVDIVDTIAELKHWKMVLAISNSESTLGKRCYGNNCSGIGVEPGHPLWRTYASTAEWAKDLNRLIEKRYKDWTLEKMNGVYNQPGSRNWLLASKQILAELQERGIE